MKEFKSARELLARGETVLCLFTRGDDLKMRPDGTGSSGYWKLDPRREVDGVLIYLRDDERRDANELFLADHDGLKGPRRPDGRYLVRLKGIRRAGFTRHDWRRFAQASMSPVRYHRR